MKVTYHMPFLNTIYAGKYIYNGYKNAFEDLGHEFTTWTSQDNSKTLFESYKPDILIFSLTGYSLKYLDLDLIKSLKKTGTKVYISTPFWKSPLSKLRINETSSLSQNTEHIDLIKSGIGDFYFNVCEEGDLRMEGFEKTTGYKHYSLPLAADKLTYYKDYSDKYKSEISFLGTNLPQKRSFINEYVLPLKKDYDLKLFGQDWTFYDKALGFTQKAGQYFNIPVIRSIQKPKLYPQDERQIYSSSLISLNFHEDYQREFGGDCNERTFKVPLCGGFEITDEVACISKYFAEGEEIVIAKSKDDWFDKIFYYLKNPQMREPIIKRGMERVLRDHTYHNRIEKMLSWDS